MPVPVLRYYCVHPRDIATIPRTRYGTVSSEYSHEPVFEISRYVRFWGIKRDELDERVDAT